MKLKKIKRLLSEIENEEYGYIMDKCPKHKGGGICIHSTKPCTQCWKEFLLKEKEEKEIKVGDYVKLVKSSFNFDSIGDIFKVNYILDGNPFCYGCQLIYAKENEDRSINEYATTTDWNYYDDEIKKVKDIKKFVDNSDYKLVIKLDTSPAVGDLVEEVLRV